MHKVLVVFLSRKGEAEKLHIFPKAPAQAKRELRLIILHKRPENQSRLNLPFLQQATQDLFGDISLSGLYGILQRMGITYQKGRPYIHSPDEFYEEKLAYLRQIIAKARQNGIEILFQDEFTLTNQVGSAKDFAPKGQQPLERWAYEEKSIRIAGAMNGLTGKTTIYQCDKMSIEHFINFLQLVVQDYPQSQTIYMPMDGWPVHFHPSVQAALVPQEQPFDTPLPPSWQKVKPKAKYQNMNLPIQMIPLPTYASWLNPIEKLWKLLKKEVTHLFPFPNNFNELLKRSKIFFKEFEDPSLRLLQFCGLLKTNGCFYQALVEADAPFINHGLFSEF